MQTGLGAGGKQPDGSKPALRALPTFRRASSTACWSRAAGSIHLECALDRIVDGFGENSLVVGAVVTAHAPEEALRQDDVDDADLHRLPPLGMHESRPVRGDRQSLSFPFPVDLRRWAMARRHADQVLAWLEAHRDDMVGLLEEVALVETPTREPDAHEPALELLADFLRDTGFHVRRACGRHLYARPEP